MSLINDVVIRQSMKELFDKTGKKMSVHTRIKNGVVEVIINRSCQECTSFHEIGDGTLVCSKCTYLKNWLERGKV